MGHAGAVPPWAYAWWGLAGALLGVGTISILTIGAPLLVAGASLVAAGAWWSRVRGRSVVALPAGLALAPAYLAWLNGHGPGMTCERTATEVACSDRWSPWPFVAVALMLVVVSIGLALLLRRRSC